MFLLKKPVDSQRKKTSPVPQNVYPVRQHLVRPVAVPRRYFAAASHLHVLPRALDGVQSAQVRSRFSTDLSQPVHDPDRPMHVLLAVQFQIQIVLHSLRFLPPRCICILPGLYVPVRAELQKIHGAIVEAGRSQHHPADAMPSTSIERRHLGRMGDARLPFPQERRRVRVGGEGRVFREVRSAETNVGATDRAATVYEVFVKTRYYYFLKLIQMIFVFITYYTNLLETYQGVVASWPEASSFATKPPSSTMVQFPCV